MTADGLGIITAPQPGAAAAEKCVFDEMTNRSLLEGNHRHTQHHMCTNAIKAQYIIVFAHFYTRSKFLTLVVAERERHTDTDCIRNGLSQVRSGRELVISTWPSLICFPFTARPTDERMDARCAYI